MTDANALLLALAIPTVTMFLIAVSGSRPNIRDGISVAASVATFAVVLRLLESVMDGARPSVTLIEVMPGLVINFAIEPLGMLFATVASGLWIVTAIRSDISRGQEMPFLRHFVNWGTTYVNCRRMR